MKKIIISIIVCLMMASCSDYNDGPTDCMIENECETCTELKEKVDQALEEYNNATAGADFNTLYYNYEKLSNCYNRSCK